MHTYIVAYEVKGAEENECGLVIQITNFFEDYCRAFPNVWIVQSPLAAADIFRILKPHLLGTHDSLLIVEISDGSAFTGFSGEIAEFLRTVL
jgi:hypothetical protein